MSGQAAGVPPLETWLPELRKQLRAKLLALLSDLGITPQVDAATGELLVPAAEIAVKLGLTEEQVRATIGADLPSMPVDRLRPLQ